MRSTSSFRSLLAAMAISLMAGATLAPTMHNRVGRVVANAPGERLRNKPPLKKKPVDTEKIRLAEERRFLRNCKRLKAQNNGGWASTSSWLFRLDLRKAVAAADAELDARYAAGAAQ